MRYSTIVLLLILVTAASCSKEKKTDGTDIIAEMHDRYDNRWYPGVYFKQQTVFYQNGKANRQQTWYEALRMPNDLIIHYHEPGSGEGMMFRADSQYVFKDGEVAKSQPFVNDLLVLGFSIYGQSPETTIEQLKASGYDLSKMFERTVDSQQQYVIGISNEDELEPHFWVDKQDLLFRGLKKRTAKGNQSEIIFEEYEQLGLGWIASKVSFYTNGEVTLVERYEDIKIIEEFDDEWFEPKFFSAFPWQAL
jgi:hypothetical protein